MYIMDSLSIACYDNLHLTETKLETFNVLNHGTGENEPKKTENHSKPQQTTANNSKRSKSMDITSGLSLEQQFQLKVYEKQVQQLTKEQAQEYLLEMLRQSMVKDNLLKDLIKQHA